MREEYGKLNRVEMSTWECCELLNEFVDESDPDLDEPQIEHLLQSAEAIRKDYPDEDWLHLTALIHGWHVASILINLFCNYFHQLYTKYYWHCGKYIGYAAIGWSDLDQIRISYYYGNSLVLISCNRKKKNECHN